jgi:hypothetical protein
MVTILARLPSPGAGLPNIFFILSTASGIDLTGSQQGPPPTGDANRKNKLRQQKQQQQQPNDLDRARRSAHRYNETPQPYYHHLEAQQRYDSMKQEEMHPSVPVLP